MPRDGHSGSQSGQRSKQRMGELEGFADALPRVS
jgi:hypothetical protein